MILLKKRVGQLICLIKYLLVKLFLIIYPQKVDFWLIAERGNDARDNGYVFYKWLRENHPEINVKYVITEDSPDRNRVKDSDVIKYGSFYHYYSYISAPALISTHYQGYSPDYRLFSQLDNKGLINVRGKKILLDHCVRMGKAGCTKDTVHIDFMICSIHKEFEALSKFSGYEEGVLQDIGMPRFDNLYNNLNVKPKRQILFMPTWRVKYTNSSEKEFLNDEYYLGVQNLLDSDKLEEFLEKNDLDFIFYPHIQMQKYLHLFKNTRSPRIQIKGAGTAVVEDLLINSQILITDYSSVFFDFAYLNKPVLYYHFDNLENERAVPKRWFSFEYDALGPVCFSVDQLIRNLESMDLKRISGMYKKRADELFGERHGGNSAIAYERIKKALKDKNDGEK